MRAAENKIQPIMVRERHPALQRVLIVIRSKICIERYGSQSLYNIDISSLKLSKVHSGLAPIDCIPGKL